MVAFSDGPGGGNPVPIVLNADGLSDEEMQRATAGFGFETAFVLKPRSMGAFRLRYFVPLREVEMCVHATVAAVTLLASSSAHGVETLVETDLRVRRVVRGSGGQVMVEMAAPEIIEPAPTATEAAAVLGVPPTSIGGPVSRVQTISVARPKTIVPVAGEEILDALSPDSSAVDELCDVYRSTGIYAFAMTDSGRYQVAARQFPCRSGYPEDPATGVAAGALAAYLSGHRIWPVIEAGYRIAQGRAMGRPSLIVAQPPDRSGTVWVGGRSGILASRPAPLPNRASRAS